MKETAGKYFVELIGTFFLVFTVGAVLLLGGQGVIPAIAIGFALMVMVYAGGHISGGHYNPAVSLAAMLRGALPAKHLIPYWVFQILGASMAAGIIHYLAGAHAPTGNFLTLPLIIGEFLFTFALCYVVLLTATTAKTNGNSFYGLSIGSTVTVGAFAVGSICYAAFNPAVAIGIAIMGIAMWHLVGITILVNLFAAVIAAIVFKMVSSECC